MSKFSGVVVACALVIFGIAVTGAKDGGTVKQSTCPQVQCVMEPVRAIGLTEIPYVGDAGIEYDQEENVWYMTFPAPASMTCSIVGYGFDASEAWHPETSVRYYGPSSVYWVENTLYFSIWTDNGQQIQDFQFTFGQAPTNLVQLPAILDADPNCPGGSCKCANKCEACCSTGFHPRCNCSGQGECGCYTNVTPAQPKPKQVDQQTEQG